MRKIMAILLSLALLLGCAAGLAEGTEKQTFGTIRVHGAFTLKGILPEGYKVVPFELSDDAILSFIRSDDAAKPEMMLSIAYDESYSDVERMNDLDDEALAALEKTFTDTDPYANITYDETAYGTRLLVSRTQTEIYDSLDILSIYKGYFVEFVMTPGKGAAEQKLTDGEVAQCNLFLSELDFVEGAEVPEVRIEGQTFTVEVSAFDAEAKTLDLRLLQPIRLTEWDAVKINVGDTITIGADEIGIVSLEYDGDDAIINEEYYLRRQEDGLYNAYDYEYPYMETAKEMTVAVPDTLVYTEQIDPETGEILDEAKTGTAADLFAALEAAKGTVAFANLDVTATFDEDGALAAVERIYVPWQ